MSTICVIITIIAAAASGILIGQHFWPAGGSK